jgi:putative chitinase
LGQVAKGSKGAEVKRLQEKLGVTADGDFGSKTEAALIAWQTKNGITPANGIADENTQIRLGLIAPTTTTTGAAAALNLKALKGVIPDSVIDEIITAADTFKITTNLRLAHFLSQCAQESGEFKVVRENLNYSATRLRQIFPKYFTEEQAKAYANKPEQIGNRVYGNRLGNGDEASGEGYLYRGRGYIQLTGKSNYGAFSKYCGADCVANPDWVASKYPLTSAAYFFNFGAKLWPTCDKGSDEATITAVTKRVNGGTHGLDGRIAYFKKYFALLSRA